MRAADARDRPLVAKERVELAPLACEDLAERGRVEVERVRPEVGEVLLELPGETSHTPARFFLPASVSTSSPPSAKRKRNIGVFGPFAPGAR